MLFCTITISWTSKAHDWPDLCRFSCNKPMLFITQILVTRLK